MYKIRHHDQNTEHKFLTISIIIVVIIILLTIISISLFSSFFSSYGAYVNSFIIILTVIALAMTAYSLFFSGTSFKLIDKGPKELEDPMVSELIDIGLFVEFVKETSDGRTYQRSIDLVKGAKKSLITVSSLEGYESLIARYSNNELRKVSNEYYQAIKRQIDRHRGKSFYREIILFPESIYNPLHLLQKREGYVRNIVDLQKTHPYSGLIYISDKSIATTFTIVDNRYVILPIFYGIKNEQQAREGILIIEDYQGELVKNLENIFDNLQAHAKPLHFWLY